MCELSEGLRAASSWHGWWRTLNVVDYHIDETITMLLKSLGWTDNSCEVKSACWGRQGRLAFRGQNS